MRLVMRFVARVACAALTLALLPRVGATQSGLSDADRRLARDIFRELIEINTTDSLGNTPRAARAMARRLVAAGFPAADVQVLIGDRKSTRLNSSSRLHLVCRLLLEKKKNAVS